MDNLFLVSRQTEQKIPLYFNGDESENLIRMQTTIYTVGVSGS